MINKNEKYMKEALKQALKAKSLDEIPVGAVIVKDGKVISRGYNNRENTSSVTGHAEMMAILKANKKLRSWRLDGCELYVTLEPCVMCTGAIIQSRIKKITFGAYDIKAGACGSVCDLLNDHAWNHKVEIESGILRDECSLILKDFFKELREKK